MQHLRIVAHRLRGERLDDVTVVDDVDAVGSKSNHPPAKPGAFASEPLKAAIGALRDPMI